MSEKIKNFIDAWINSYVYAESCSLDDVDSLVQDITRDSEASGISLEEIEVVIGSPIRSHLLEVLTRLDR